MAARPWIGVAGVAAFAAVVTWFGILHRDKAAAPPASSSSQSADSSPAAPQTAPAPADARPAPGGTGQAESPEPQAAPAASAKVAAGEPSRTVGRLPLPPPTFDIVRVEPSGDTVVAGEGAPGATVELLRNGQTYARSVADGGGQWAIVPAPLPKGAALLTLRVTTPDGRIVASDQVVTVQVPEKTGDGVVVVLNAPDTPSRVLTAEGVAAAKPAAQSAAAEPKVALESSAAGKRDATTPPTMTAPVKTEPAAPKVAAIDASATPPASGEPARAVPGAPPAMGTKLLAAAPNARSRANARVVTVEADESGRFFVTGQAEPGAEIRIYLNETALATVQAAADGGFGMTIEKGMTPGDYRVRIDDIEPGSGKVLTRAEVPFTMGAARKAVAAAKPAQETTRQAGQEATQQQAQGLAKTAAAGSSATTAASGKVEPPGGMPSTAEPSTATPAAPAPARPAAPKVLASRDISPAIEPPALASPPTPSSPTTAVEPASPQSPQERTPPPAETAQPTPPAGDVAPAVGVAEPAQQPAASPEPAAGSRVPEPQSEPNVALATPGDAPAAGASEPAQISEPAPAAGASEPAPAAGASEPAPAAGASEPAPAGNVAVAEAKPLTPTPSVAIIPEIKTVIVARGDNLWRISRKTYGRGIRYTIIYGANSEQIRNPHLIYPGQIFVTPEDKG